MSRCALPSVSGEIGLEVNGLDLREATPEILRHMSLLLPRHKVLCVRAQTFDVDRFHSIVKSMGVPKQHVLSNVCLADNNDVMILSNKKENGEPVGISDAGRVWHTDMSFDVNPPSYTFLYATDVPTYGGNTLFVDMERVLRELPLDVSNGLNSLSGIFSYTLSYNKKLSQHGSLRKPLSKDQLAQLTDAKHPLVKIHDVTKSKSLYISQAHILRIDGLPKSESRDLISYLTSESAKNVDYEHRWKPGDLLMWDNRSVIHRAMPYPMNQLRHIYRMMVQ